LRGPFGFRFEIRIQLKNINVQVQVLIFVYGSGRHLDDVLKIDYIIVRTLTSDIEVPHRIRLLLIGT
jgi:hypothetical protein